MIPAGIGQFIIIGLSRYSSYWSLLAKIQCLGRLDCYNTSGTKISESYISNPQLILESRQVYEILIQDV